MSVVPAGSRIGSLHVGGIHAGRRSVAIRTVLGSCVAACLDDPGAGVGELLINRIMKLGGARLAGIEPVLFEQNDE